MKNLLKIGVSLVLIGLVATTLNITLEIPLAYTAIALFAAGFIKGLLPAQNNMSGTLAYDGFVMSDTTYAGEAASSFIVKAITSNETVQGGHVYVKDGIKYKMTIPRFDVNYEDIIQDRQATPVSKGDMTVDGKVLTPADYMIYIEFNPRDYEAHWFASQLNPTLIDRTLPVSVESTVVQEVLKRHDRYVNKIIWGGDTTTTGVYKYFDGFVKKATDATDTLDLAAASILTTTLAANILAEIARIYALIPAQLQYDPNMKLFLSYELYSAYEAAMIAATNKGIYYDSGMGGNMTYRGLKVVKIADFPQYKMMFARGTSDMTSNLWMGTNSTEDATIQVSKVQANSELYFIKMLCKLDVQFGWNSEVVNYV